jgi:hypothetical protein
MRMGIDQAGQQHRPMPIGRKVQLGRARIAFAQQLNDAAAVDDDAGEPLDIAQGIEREARNMVDQSVGHSRRTGQRRPGATQQRRELRGGKFHCHRTPVWAGGEEWR